MAELLDMECVPMSISFSITTSDIAIKNILIDRGYLDILDSKQIHHLRKKYTAQWYERINIQYPEYMNYDINRDMIFEWLEIPDLSNAQRDIREIYNKCIESIR